MMNIEGSPREPDFEIVWPVLRRTVDHILQARRIPEDVREDALQETGLRLFQRWNGLHERGALEPLALTIALNCVRDEFRKAERRTLFEEMPEHPSPLDVEESGITRLELRRVARALKQLKPNHRAALISEVSDDDGVAEPRPAAVRMLTMRARRNLIRVLETASLWLGLKIFRLRKTGLDSAVHAAAVLAAAALALNGVAAAPAAAHPVLHHTGHDVTKRHAHERSSAKGRTPAPHHIDDRPGPTISSALVPPKSGEGIRPVRVKVGNASVEAAVSVTAANTTVVVGENGGPAPVCTEGGPARTGLECPPPE